MDKAIDVVIDPKWHGRLHHLNHLNYVVIATAGNAGHVCSTPSMNNDGATLDIFVRNDSGSAANADIYVLVVTADATDYIWP